MTDRIDDKHVEGNPFDHTKWIVEPRGGRWFVFDGMGKRIFEGATEAEVRQ